MAGCVRSFVLPFPISPSAEYNALTYKKDKSSIIQWPQCIDDDQVVDKH